MTVSNYSRFFLNGCNYTFFPLVHRELKDNQEYCNDTELGFAVISGGCNCVCVRCVVLPRKPTLSACDHVKILGVLLHVGFMRVLCLCSK
jgi:hypothetical protein